MNFSEIRSKFNFFIKNFCRKIEIIIVEIIKMEKLH